MILLLLVACTPEESETPPDDTSPVHTETELPGHSDCLPEGEQMSEEVCLAIVEESGRSPSQSQYKVYSDPPVPDPRVDDPDYEWLLDQTKRCTCTCCHTTSYGGPAVFHWDVEFEPMWIDSASNWALEVYAGFEYSENQRLPIEDQDRLQEVVRAELDRRFEAQQER